MSGRTPACEDAAAITARIAELRRERMRALAGCVCGTLGPRQHDAAGNIVHAPQCPLGPTPPSQMQLTLEAMQRARARLRQAGVPIRQAELRVEVEREEDGRWIAEAPEMPGLLVYGATELEARNNVALLVERAIRDKCARHRVLS